ncbi:unnamed protein product, partial [Allacma fusca]
KFLVIALLHYQYAFFVHGDRFTRDECQQLAAEVHPFVVPFRGFDVALLSVFYITMRNSSHCERFHTTATNLLQFQRVMSTCFIFAIILGPVASIALIASNSFSANSQDVLEKATCPKILKSIPINITERDYTYQVNNGLQKSSVFRMLENKPQLRLLYKTLQSKFECCGVTNFSDCTGISPLVHFIRNYSEENAWNSGLPRNQLSFKTLTYNTHPITPIQYGADYREEVCKTKCLNITVPCVDEIKTGNEYCREAITSVLITFYAVFIYTVVICWYYRTLSMRQNGRVSIFTFINDLQPVLPTFPTLVPLPPQPQPIFKNTVK